jgi:hypothetical protein
MQEQQHGTAAGRAVVDVFAVRGREMLHVERAVR